MVYHYEAKPDAAKGGAGLRNHLDNKPSFKLASSIWGCVYLELEATYLMSHQGVRVGAVVKEEVKKDQKGKGTRALCIPPNFHM